jgi:hypothetical protein
MEGNLVISVRIRSLKRGEWRGHLGLIQIEVLSTDPRRLLREYGMRVEKYIGDSIWEQLLFAVWRYSTCLAAQIQLYWGC